MDLVGIRVALENNNRDNRELYFFKDFSLRRARKEYLNYTIVELAIRPPLRQTMISHFIPSSIRRFYSTNRVLPLSELRLHSPRCARCYRDLHRALHLRWVDRPVGSFERGTFSQTATRSCGVTEVINLRVARKRAARAAAAKTAAENRQTHGVSKAERTRLSAERESGDRKLDAHKIETGARR